MDNTNVDQQTQINQLDMIDKCKEQIDSENSNNLENQMQQKHAETINDDAIMKS